MQSDALSDQLSPSDKYKTKDVDQRTMKVEKMHGIMAPLTVLPTAEMPNKTIFGHIDPLDGSPARKMTEEMLKGDLLGEFAKVIREERKGTQE